MPSHLHSKVLHRLNLCAAPTSFSRAKKFIHKIDSRSSVDCDGVEIVLRGFDNSRRRRYTNWTLVKKGAREIIAAAQKTYCDDRITKIVLQNWQFVQAFSHDKPLQTKSIVAKTSASVLDCRTNRGGPGIPPAPIACPMETPELPEDIPPLDPEMFTGFEFLPGSLPGSLAGSLAGSPCASPNPTSFAAPHPSEMVGMSFSDAFNADKYGVLQGVAGNFEVAIEELHL